MEVVGKASRLMRTEDLPLSTNVADRRNKPEAETLQQHIDQAQAEPQPERGAPYSDSELAEQAGIKDIGKVVIAVVGIHLGYIGGLILLG